MLKSLNMDKKKKVSESQPKYSTQQLRTAKFTWLPKKTFELLLTVAWSEVKLAYNQELKKIAQITEIKGFRKGKAPLNLVEQNIDKKKLYEEVVRSLIPEYYEEAVKKYGLRPIMAPKINIISLQENSDWQFKASSCEKPDIKLGNYKQHIQGEFAKEKIWVPNKGKINPNKDKKISKDDFNKIKHLNLGQDIFAKN